MEKSRIPFVFNFFWLWFRFSNFVFYFRTDWQEMENKKKERKIVIFLSVEDDPTIDKKRKKSRIPWFLCFSILCEGFVFYRNIIICPVFYLVRIANRGCVMNKFLIILICSKIETNWVLSGGVHSCCSKRMTEISDISYLGF